MTKLTCQYLVVSLGDSRQSTPSISKTLNPEWYESFELPITGPRCLLLEAVCWDKDRFKKDYMGEFDLAIEDLFVTGQTSSEVCIFFENSRRFPTNPPSPSGIPSSRNAETQRKRAPRYLERFNSNSIL